MKVLVIGGTGFLGYHTCWELSERGHSVTALGVPPAPQKDLLPAGVEVVLQDLGQLSALQLKQLLRGYEAVVFAAGADDRATPKSPAWEFFYEANVRSTARLTSAAMHAGVNRLIILGSYFTYFNRTWPHMELATRHPYVNSRKQQMELATDIAGDKMAVVILELPYIFGSMPGSQPLWTPLINYVRSGVPLVYPRGGSNMIAVSRVAQAIAGACERIDESRVFQVGDKNVHWTEFLQALCRIVGRQDDKIHTIAGKSLKNAGWILDALHTLEGLEGGLHARHFADIQSAEAFFSPTESRRALGYRTGGLKQAWIETVTAAPEGVMFRNWKQFLEHVPGLSRMARKRR